MEVDSTSFEEVIRIPWVKSMKKDVIPERTITVGYNGPTKCQCDSRWNVERYKAKFVTKVLVKEKKEHMRYHNSKFIYGLKKATRRWYLKFK